MSAGPKDLPPASAPSFQEAVRERTQTLLGFRGDPMDQALTPRRLGWSAVETIGGGRGGVVVRDPGATGGTGSTEADLMAPPNVSGLTVGAGISHVFVQFDAPAYAWGGGNRRTNIYGVAKETSDATLPTFGDAQRIYSMEGPLAIASIPSEPNMRWHLWAKHESFAGEESAEPAGGLNGATATTGQDVSHLISTLSGAITRQEIDADVWRTNVFAIGPPAGSMGIDAILPFTVLTSDTVVNGVTFAKGVYMDAAYIVNLTAMVARLGEAWIDSAMVSDLSAAHLTAGDGTVGGTLKSSNYVFGVSGWLLNPFLGRLYAMDADISGRVTATSGAIGGIVIDSGGIRSPSFVAGSSGLRMGSDGSAEFNNVTVRGAVYATSGEFSGDIVVGTTPVISGTTMAGSGAVINSDGTFALGNSTTNITFDGTQTTINGELVFAGNIAPGAVSITKLARGASLPDYVRTYRGTTAPLIPYSVWEPLELDSSAILNRLGATDYDAYRTLLTAGTYFYELSVPAKNESSDTNDAVYTSILLNPPGTTSGYTVLSEAGVNVVGDWQTATIFGVGRFTVASSTYISVGVTTSDDYPAVRIMARAGYCTSILRIWRDEGI